MKKKVPSAVMENSNIFKELYLKAKAIAKEQNNKFTYDDLAELTGVKKNTLACWIIGTRNPPDYAKELFVEKYAKKLTDREFLKEYLEKKQIAE